MHFGLLTLLFHGGSSPVPFWWWHRWAPIVRVQSSRTFFVWFLVCSFPDNISGHLVFRRNLGHLFTRVYTGALGLAPCLRAVEKDIIHIGVEDRDFVVQWRLSKDKMLHEGRRSGMGLWEKGWTLSQSWNTMIDNIWSELTRKGEMVTLWSEMPFFFITCATGKDKKMVVIFLTWVKRLYIL